MIQKERFEETRRVLAEAEAASRAADDECDLAHAALVRETHSWYSQ